MRKIIFFIVFCLHFSIYSLVNNPHLVILPRPESDKDGRSEYRKQLLQLILDKTKSEYKKDDIAKFSAGVMTQDRSIEEIKTGSEDVTVIATPSSPSREEALNPIRIPLDKGLIGYRLLLINKNEKDKFDKIKTLDELKKYSACFKKEWVDYNILSGNGIVVANGSSYEGLFQMLDTGHCSWFPRGLNEIYPEFKTRSETLKNLDIAESFALYYPFPVYFFVAKSNTQLQERLEKGFKKIIEDGSFDKLFYQFNGAFIKNANLESKHIIQLENPILPKNVPLNQKNYWLKFNK